MSLHLSAAKKLHAFNPAGCHALLGLDGFVDNIIDVVDKRSDFENYSRIETIDLLAGRIGRAAGLSSNLELVVRQMKLGGNGPIMANALIEAGCQVSYIGSVGRPAIHPVFAEMAARCSECIGLCDPGHTDALEFRDGKLMLGKHQTLKEVTYERMLDVVGIQRMRQAWERSHLVALTNWTMLPRQTDIWKGLLRDMAGVKVPKDAILFIDLADPEKRLADELSAACLLLKRFRSSHRVILGLNQKESMEVGAALQLKLNPADLQGNASALQNILELDMVVIHPTKEAACATKNGTARVDGPYCENPMLTTGAGDNFNAGLCLGLLAGIEAEELLLIGAAASGFYVRNGRSAKASELCRFLEQLAAPEGVPS